MKSMTFKELGGACDQIFSNESFEEMAKLSQEHGKEMYMAKDSAYIEAMNEMQSLMQDPEAMNKWMEEKKAAFNQLEYLLGLSFQHIQSFGENL